MKHETGGFEELILLEINRSGNTYCAEIQRNLSETTGRVTSTGAIFSALKRCEKKGYLYSYQGVPERVRGGRRKRYYQLEEKGREALVRMNLLREKGRG